MKIDWVRKLTSRKWWIAVAAFIVAAMLLFGADSTVAEKVGALILLAADVVGYTLAEGLADAGGQTSVHIKGDM